MGVGRWDDTRQPARAASSSDSGREPPQRVGWRRLNSLESAMVSMTALILPIVISAVLVFILSALLWTVAPHHKGERKGVSNEEAVRAALLKPAPGLYMIPFAATPEARKDPAFL